MSQSRWFKQNLEKMILTADPTLKSFIRKVYIFKFFDDLLFITPLYTIMFSQNNLSAFQISALLAAGSFTAFILEIPTGVLADRYSRKRLLVFAQIAQAAGFAFWFVPGFYTYLAGVMLWAAKIAMSSGTFEAIVYDGLKKLNEHEKFAKVTGRIQTVSLLAGLISSGAASAAIFGGFPLVIGLSILSLVFSLIPVLALPEIEQKESVPKTDYFSLLHEGRQNWLKKGPVIHLMLVLGLLYLVYTVFDEYCPIFITESKFPVFTVGIIMGAISAAQAAGNIVAYKFEHFSNRILTALIFMDGLCLLTASLFMRPAAIILILLYNFLFQIIAIVLLSRVQHAIPSSKRATITSVIAFFGEILEVPFYLGFGALANHQNYKTAFVCLGVLMTMVGAVFLIFTLYRYDAGAVFHKAGSPDGKSGS